MTNAEQHDALKPGGEGVISTERCKEICDQISEMGLDEDLKLISGIFRNAVNNNGVVAFY